MAIALNIEKLKGKTFTYLTLMNEELPHITKGGHKHRTARFKCKCGKEKIIQISSVLNNLVKSCGCYSAKIASKRMIVINTKHGMYNTPEYNIWVSMKKRCKNQSHKYYNDYGGRGIMVCEEWDKSFENFIYDMGKRPNNQYSIERLDNNNGYYKENCIWATKKQQTRNVRSNVILIANGEKKCLSEYAEILGFSWQKLYYRLFVSKNNYSLEEMLKNEYKT
jgi:hypothetical protein